jgi:hypothetical protein
VRRAKTRIRERSGKTRRAPVACDRGQFAATVRAGGAGSAGLSGSLAPTTFHLCSGVPLVFRRATACGGSVSLAHIGT